MATETQEQINSQLKSENEKLKLQNEELSLGLKDLSEKFNKFASVTTPAAVAEKLTIPTETFEVKVGKETFKIKFLIPKFRLNNDTEVTALEASTDDGIMQKLILSNSGIIEIVEE
jgi:hypothetical protein